MEYTIQVSRVKDDNNLKAMASIIFEGAYKVNNISIVEAKGHTFINMPSYQTHEVDDNGRAVYKDICHSISSDFSKQLYKDILKLYKDVCETNSNSMDMDFGEENGLNVSVSVHPIEKDNVAAIASVYFDNKFVVNNIRIMNGAKGEFISMPNYKTNKLDDAGKPVYKDICYPVTAEFREKLYGDIVNAYHKLSEDKDKNIDSPVKHNSR